LNLSRQRSNLVSYSDFSIEKELEITDVGSAEEDEELETSNLVPKKSKNDRNVDSNHSMTG
jgi:hypothetical protein